MITDSELNVRREWAGVAERATNPAVLLKYAREAYLGGQKTADYYIILMDRLRHVTDNMPDPIAAWENVIPEVGLVY